MVRNTELARKFLHHARCGRTTAAKPLHFNSGAAFKSCGKALKKQASRLFAVGL